MTNANSSGDSKGSVTEITAQSVDFGRWYLDVVRRAETRGLDSVWVTDHVIVPRDAVLIYRDHMLDPLAVLPWLAGVTERIALGTSVEAQCRPWRRSRGR